MLEQVNLDNVRHVEYDEKEVGEYHIVGQHHPQLASRGIR